MRDKMTETELASVVSEWLKKECWDVFPEVVLPSFGGRPDLIATRNNICKVIECKVNTNLSVVEQAIRWRNPSRDVSNGMPHLIVIAVNNYTFNSSSILKMIVKQMGIGVVSVSKYRGGFNSPGMTRIGDNTYMITEQIAPRIQPGSRQFGARLIEQLNDDMKIATPGAKGGETVYMTPFKRTMNRVNELMVDGKERHIDTIIQALNLCGGHHYSSDTSAKTQIYTLCRLAGCEQVGQWGRYLKIIK